MTKEKIIFFGNGPLADFALEALKEADLEIIFHAREKADLEKVKELKKSDPSIHGILASYGVIIKPDVLELFEPEGILNIHPSLLPQYRGPSPIETAILNGDTTFGVSVMKLVSAMDAGPIFYQASFPEKTIFKDANISFAPDYKPTIYKKLASAGADWIAKHLTNLPTPTDQSISDTEPTFCQKFDKSMSPLDPNHKTAKELENQIRAFSGFPKSKYTFFGLDCIVISAHVATSKESKNCQNQARTLLIKCYDQSALIIDQIQPAGRKIMDAKSFINGYAK